LRELRECIQGLFSQVVRVNRGCGINCRETGSALKPYFVVPAVVTLGAIFGVTGTALGASPPPPVPYNPVMGQALVSRAEQIARGGSPWTGGCVPATGSSHCVPYSWGGGHGPQPGPTDGICQGWGRPTGAPKTLFAGPACAASVTKAHPNGYGDNGTYGLDCSGFARWVYALVYRQDVLGPGTTTAQQSQPGLAKIPAGQQQPGDLLFFPGHVAIYAGRGTMVDEPQTYDRPSSPAGHWTHAYARVDPVGQQVLGYYRFTVPKPAPSPAPSPTPSPSPIPSPTPPPWIWPPTATTPEGVWDLGGGAPKD
jgi:cell wall-associated NlpC family hydrolase